MSTEIEREFTFQAGVYFEQQFIMNLYDFKLTLEVNTESIREQNVAMERIKFFIYEKLENCIFVNEKEKKIIEKYNDCNFKVCHIPEDPYDQIISLILLLKLEAITEGKLKILEIVLTSKLSDEVKFKEVIETARMHFGSDGWYNESSTSISGSNKISNKKEKIVKLVSNDWNDVGLSWKEKQKSKQTAEILFISEP